MNLRITKLLRNLRRVGSPDIRLRSTEQAVIELVGDANRGNSCEYQRKIKFTKEDYDDEYYRNMETGIASNPVSIIHGNDLRASIYGTKILSIGCGTGVMEHRIKTQMPHIQIIGADFTETEVQKELWNKYGLEVVVADGAQQPFPDESFDTCFTSHVLEHVPEPKKVIQESIRLTRHIAVHLTPINLNMPDHIHFFKFSDIDNEYRTQDADIDLKILADNIVSELKSKLPKIEYELQISCPRDGSRDYGDMKFPIKRPDRPDGLFPCFLIKFYKYGKCDNKKNNEENSRSNVP